MSKVKRGHAATGKSPNQPKISTNILNIPYRWKAANFDLCSALIAIEQWGFFSVPHLLWYGASVYNGDFQGPVTLAPIAERIAVEMSLPVFTTLVCHGLDSNTQPSAIEPNALTHCATDAVFMLFVKA